jgi:hypothetical protein
LRREEFLGGGGERVDGDADGVELSDESGELPAHGSLDSFGLAELGDAQEGLQPLRLGGDAPCPSRSRQQRLELSLVEFGRGRRCRRRTQDRATGGAVEAVLAAALEGGDGAGEELFEQRSDPVGHPYPVPHGVLLSPG